MAERMASVEMQNPFHFMELYGKQDTPYCTADIWDAQANAWEARYRDPAQKARSGNERIEAVAAFLRDRGLLGPDCDVVDIGCGPGRFAADFATTAHSVLGLDVSPKMIAYGNAHIKREHKENVSLRVCDFRALDPAREGLAGRFDLAFSSLTPAVRDKAGLEKMLAMSRAYCFNSTSVHEVNAGEERMLQACFGIARRPRFDGRRFYALFHALFLMGYYPEITFYKQSKTCLITPDEAYARALAKRLVPKADEGAAAKRMLAWLQQNAGPNGQYNEQSTVWHAWMLWDVRQKTDRSMG